MKKTNKKNSKMRKLLPAFAMLTVSAISLSSATYAWFTMNKEVTVTGMMMRTKVSENLLISDDTLDSEQINADSTFNNSLVQGIDGFIEPVSTVDGKNFFYTAGTNVQGNGAVLNNVWSTYDPDDVSDFANEYALTGADADAVTGYVDYVYQLKAINGSTPSQIRLKDLTLTYGGVSDANGQKATRVAVFAEDLGYKTGSSDSTLKDEGFVAGPDVLKAIYTPPSAANFTSGKAVSDEDELDDVTYNETFTLDVGTNCTQYYKIVVRVWLEGEDTTCNNTTFMDLTDKWSLDMAWELTADATPYEADSSNPSVAYVPKVGNITLAYTAAKTALATNNTTGTDTMTISGVTYKPLSGKTLGASGPQLYITDDTFTVNSRVYIISADGLYPTDVTNQVTITEST